MRQAVPAVRYRCLCENGTAAAELFAVLSKQLSQLALFWQMTEIAPVVICTVLCIYM